MKILVQKSKKYFLIRTFNKLISIFTTYTDPEKRFDPWKEALECYNSLADEVIIEGSDWPYEFKWDLIGKTFQKGFDKCSGDWVIRMDIDYFFHEKILIIYEKLLKKTQINQL